MIPLFMLYVQMAGFLFMTLFFMIKAMRRLLASRARLHYLINMAG